MDLKNKNIKNLDYDNIPKHVGIIMDGNGRWAKKRNLPRTMGHKAGSERVIEIVEAAHDLGIKSLSLFAFSTENWKRPQGEISKLMELLVFYLRTQIKKLNENNIKLNILGDYSLVAPSIKKEIELGLSLTEANDKMILNIAFNYGGQDEIINATKLIGEKIKMGEIQPEDVNKKLFEEFLYTKGQPELDLLIRPSGELRISNFMLYQMAYSELWFSDCLWPDFTTEVFVNAIIDFQNRDRRFGGI